MGLIGDNLLNVSIESEVVRRANKLRISIHDASAKQKEYVQRLSQESLINNEDEKLLISSIDSAVSTVEILIEMFENTKISTEAELKKYVMAINEVIGSLNTGIVEEINLTLDASPNADKEL